MCLDNLTELGIYVFTFLIDLANMAYSIMGGVK